MSHVWFMSENINSTTFNYGETLSNHLLLSKSMIKFDFIFDLRQYRNKERVKCIAKNATE